jgi:predicted nucleic acid-binding protein
VRAYFDSSALAKRYVVERGSAKVEQLLQGTDELGVCVLSLPEIISALCRLRRESALAASEYNVARSALLHDVGDADVVQLTGDVLQRSIKVLESHSLRSADAIHLAAALEWQADLFVSADRKQLDVATRLKLKTVSV